jgi:hypothetical protein
MAQSDLYPRVEMRSGPARPNGALAQLGERLICIQEVIGSIPIGSTRTCEGSDGLVAQVVRAYA